MNLGWLAGLFNSRKKKATWVGFLSYYPLMQVFAGVPAQTEFSIFDLTPQAFAIFQFVSLLVTILASMIGIGFTLHNSSKNDKKELNEKWEKRITGIEERMDDKTEEIMDEIHAVERRIGKNADQRFMNLTKSLEEKVIAAKVLEDERIDNIKHRLTKIEYNKVDRAGDR